MINWRSIKEVGYPTDDHKDYFVTDGKDISTSEARGNTTFKGSVKTFTFKFWYGDVNTWEDNSCCSGERIFDMRPTHWCPTDEVNLPKD